MRVEALDEVFVLKKVLLRIICVVLLLVSTVLILYPFISNYLMSLNDTGKIMEFENSVENIDKKTISKIFEDAKKYNVKFLGDVVITDPFDPEFQPNTDIEYENILNINNDGMMGYVEIPVIDVSLPIFHGTSGEVLEKGAGHLQNTSLPVGGENSHSVITGHTAYSAAKLFTDINQLILGDVFYIHVLDETLAYEVDNIKVVLPNETNDLRIVMGEDLVTLVTCTPYGINSHRLLVRGKRIPYEKTEEKIIVNDRVIESTWMKEYKFALKIGGSILISIVLIFVIVRLLLKRKRRKKAKISSLPAKMIDENSNKTE